MSVMLTFGLGLGPLVPWYGLPVLLLALGALVPTPEVGHFWHSIARIVPEVGGHALR